MTILTACMFAIASIPSLSATIEGEGYFRFAQNGRIVYSRTATFVVDEGRLEDAKGASVIPLINVPAEASSFTVDPDGTISFFIGAKRKEAGRLTLAVFPTSTKLNQHGNYLAAQSRPSLEDPGNGKAGLIRTSDNGSIVDAKASRPKTTRTTPSNSVRPSLMIAETVVLKGATITLGEIAQTSGLGSLEDRIGAIQFGPAPRNGITYRLARERIVAKLRLAGFDEADFTFDCPDVVKIEAASQLVSAEEFIESAKQAAISRFGSNLELRVVNDVTPFKAPLGTLELKADQGQALKDRFDVNVFVIVDGRRINSKLVSLSGDALAVAVKANSAVKIRLSLNGITIESTGKAKKDARIGETVEVAIRLSDGDKESLHYATVVGPGLVEIKI